MPVQQKAQQLKRHQKYSLEFNFHMGYMSAPIPVKVFDEMIFEKYQQAHIAVLSDLRPDLSCLIKLKKQFLNDEVKNFAFTYNKNKHIDYRKIKNLLHNLLHDISNDTNIPEIIVHQYQLAIDEKLTKITMLMQTQVIALGGDITLAMKKFQECSNTLYGVIDPNIFCKTLQIIERDINRRFEKYKSDNDKIKPAKRLLSIIDTYKSTQENFHTLEVTPRVLKEKQSALTDALELQRLFTFGLLKYGISKDWSVVIDKRGARSYVTVSYNLKKIYLPSSTQLEKRGKRKKLTDTRIEGLIAHEIGTHVLRQENGEKSALKLLSSGLSGYEQGEEGLATFREQQAQSLNGYAGLEAYFTIGLVQGLGTGSPQDFFGVHQILTDYYQVMENTTLHHAKELAWNRCVRTFMGTTGTIPGIFFSKDLIYRHGNINHREALENGKLNDVDLDSGKFDPTNDNHIKFLQELKKLQ